MADETFERFRRKLADVVLEAIEAGFRVRSTASQGDGNHCPLACHPRITGNLCGGLESAKAFDISPENAWNFMRGFDIGDLSGDPYTKLGRLYRERFP